MSEVPCISCEDMSETQKRAYILADNRIAINADWDAEMLGVEIRDLANAEFDLELLGFDSSELDEMMGGLSEFNGEGEEGKYTEKVESPVYEPTGEEPAIQELVDTSKMDDLLGEIGEADLPEDVSFFFCNMRPLVTPFLITPRLLIFTRMRQRTFNALWRDRRLS